MSPQLSREKKIFSTSYSRATRDPYRKKDEFLLLSHTVHKNLFEMGHRLKESLRLSGF